MWWERNVVKSVFKKKKRTFKLLPVNSTIYTPSSAESDWRVMHILPRRCCVLYGTIDINKMEEPYRIVSGKTMKTGTVVDHSDGLEGNRWRLYDASDINNNRNSNNSNKASRQERNSKRVSNY